jgi:Zn finger protein HypA/HybF involved in hydrogenase expression
MKTKEEKILLNDKTDFLDVCLLKEEKQQEEISPIVFYCKDCEKLVKVIKKDKSLKFYCKECNGKNISYGTRKSLEKFYNL